MLPIIIIEADWTLKFPLWKLETFSSFWVTYVFKEELNKIKWFCLKFYKFLIKFCLYMGLKFDSI